MKAKFLSVAAAVGIFGSNCPAFANIYDLTVLAGLPGSATSIAVGVNDAGQVVGYSFSITGGIFSEQAVIWNGTTPTVLNSPPPSPQQ